MTMTTITPRSLHHSPATPSSRFRLGPTLRFGVLLPTLAALPLQSPGANVGQSLKLEANAVGTKPFVYQWFKDGTPISGATSSIFSISSLLPGDGGTYYVQIANSGGVSSSLPVTVVVDAATVAPTIMTSPLSQTVAEGQSLSLKVAATGGAPLLYQWQKDGVALPGATSAILSLTNTTVGDSGNYSVVVSNGAGSITSSVATLNVQAWSANTLSSTATETAVAARTVVNSGIITLKSTSVGPKTGGVFEHLTQTATGDFDYRLQVSSLSSTSTAAKAGQMVAPVTGTSANLFFNSVSTAGKANFFKTDAASVTTTINNVSAKAPIWFRLARSGNVVRSYRSTNGTTWTNMGANASTLPATVLVGPWLTSGSTTISASATFANQVLSFLPLPWSSVDVGAPTMAGASHFNSGSFVLVSASADIGNIADQFRFTYIAATGDCEVVAKVASVSNSNPEAKAGVMIRESLTNSSRFVMAACNPLGTVSSHVRATTGAGATVQTPFGIATPWVKIVRVGSRFDTYAGPDGRSWSLLESVTVPMGSTVYVGLAGTSKSTSTLGSSVFESVSVRP